MRELNNLKAVLEEYPENIALTVVRGDLEAVIRVFEVLQQKNARLEEQLGILKNPPNKWADDEMW